MDYVTVLEWLKTAIDVFDVDDEMSHMIQLCQHTEPHMFLTWITACYI